MEFQLFLPLLMIFFEFQVPAKKPLGGDVEGSLRAVSPREYSNKSPEENSETGWPVFKDGDKVLPTEFKEGSWKCPLPKRPCTEEVM